MPLTLVSARQPRSTGDYIILCVHDIMSVPAIIFNAQVDLLARLVRALMRDYTIHCVHDIMFYYKRQGY